MSENYVANDFAAIAKSLADLKKSKQDALEKDPNKVVPVSNVTTTTINDDYFCY